jgi:hypothetical protein
MKKLKGIQLLLSIVVSLLILVFLAYYNYDNLTRADFLSSALSYQNLDEESPLGNSLNKSKIPPQSFICFVSLPGFYLFTQPLHPDPQTSFLWQRTSILRC